MKRSSKYFITILSLGSALLFLSCDNSRVAPDARGNVIFIHADGTGLAQWTAGRIYHYGPDAKLNWDKLPHIGLYRGHLKNALTASSEAGATIHAYGVKANYRSYGMIDGKLIPARSGKKKSIMQEAMDADIKVGVINSGTIIEPGTGVFLASALSRNQYEIIAEKIIFSKANLIFCGGEEWLIPKDVVGFHGKYGKRTDNRNLLNEIRLHGYEVIYTLAELESLDSKIDKVIGIFATADSYNDQDEETLQKNDLPLYYENAPTVAEMTEVALRILSRNDKQFLLVIEEEATDNFANYNNAIGTLEALKRADDAIGVALEHYGTNKNTLILTSSDSEAGGLELHGPPCR
ncbi:alkaline phosphatase [Candidatus Neomarinimicrobiota bacterium]